MQLVLHDSCIYWTISGIEIVYEFIIFSNTIVVSISSIKFFINSKATIYNLHYQLKTLNLLLKITFLSAGECQLFSLSVEFVFESGDSFTYC